jgi:acyl phosphate:glycerol-3-phosphate acyltransferase
MTDSPATLILWIFASYIIGSLPTGYLVAKWLKGIDIRTVGSGNPGATNVFRSIGKGPGLLTLAVDVLKGWIPTWLALRHLPGMTAPVFVGLAAVAGHTWSPFLRFHGGKGVATSAGVFGALLPAPTLAAFAAFAAGFGLSKHVSVGSLAASVVLPVAAFWWRGLAPESWLAAGVSALVIVKHIPNIRRLMRGEEQSIVKK